MFNRYHIISPNHINGIARHIKKKKSNASIKDLIIWLKPIGSECDSLIMVKQCSPDGKDVLENGLPAANLFAAIVSLACYCKNLDISYCALRENLSKQERKVGTAFSIDEESIVTGHHSQLDSPDPYITPRHYKMTRTELRKLILSNEFGFGKVLLQDEESMSPFRSELEMAVRTLDSAIRQRDQSLKLLGCVAAVDTLFEDSNTKFDRLKRRLKVILNEPTFNWLRVNEVLQARHDTAHKGKKVDEKELARRAVHLAIMAVISYSNLVRLFPNRKSMFAHLDAISLVKEVSNHSQGEVCIEMAKIGKKIRSEFSKLTKIGYTRNLVVNDQLADYMMDRLKPTV